MHALRRTLIALVTIAAVLSPTSLTGQEAAAAEAPGGSAMISAGLGAGSLDLGWQLALAYTLPRGHHVVVRHSATTEFVIFGPAEATARDVALMYGATRPGRRSWLRAAVGPALVRVTRPGEARSCSFWSCDHEDLHAYTAGLAVQGDAVWAPARAFGIGPSLAANLNPEKSFAVLVLAIHLGGVR